MSTLLIITGSSRGLGAALAKAATEAGHQVIGIARGDSASGRGVRHDLANPEGLIERLSPVFEQACETDPQRIVLVNNAGMLDPVGESVTPQSVPDHLTVNLGAAVLLTRWFIERLAEHQLDKRVINISSGAATRAIRGWSLYCASKAGLEHFGRCVALEQRDARFPVDLVNISPGVIDTDMQAHIRASDASVFADVAQFRQLKEQGALATPEHVAAKLLRGINAPRRFDGATVAIDDFATAG
jgi:benzil reductase ((S)-benzoin forming)